MGVLIGEGAMSTVSRAEDELLRRPVAVKLLKPIFALDEQLVAHFYAEARIAAHIVDQHVVAIYDVLSEDDSHAIVMEFIDGRSVADLLEAQGRFAESQAIEYARQAALGLRAAHARGVLHRDVKPANLLVTRDGILKVADFGLAMIAGPNDATLMQPGHMFGSVHYFSPEQAQGAPLTPASDLYSLGVVLYQLCTGTLPFTGETPLSVAVAHVQQPSPSLARLQGLMSRGLAQIVFKLLQKDPQLRYASAADLAAALEALQAPEPVPPSRPAAAPTMSASMRARTIAIELFHAARTWLLLLVARAETARERPTRKMAATPFGVILGLCVIAILIGDALAHRSQPTIRLGDFRGRSLAQSRRVLRIEGLTTAIATRYDEHQRAGAVLAQQPAPGAMVRKNDRIALTVSAGLPLVRMPSITGKILRDAARVMANVPLKIRFTAKVSDAPVYTVIAQSPAAGERVREQSAAVITLSTGPQPAVNFPDGNPPPVTP